MGQNARISKKGSQRSQDERQLNLELDDPLPDPFRNLKLVHSRPIEDQPAILPDSQPVCANSSNSSKKKILLKGDNSFNHHAEEITREKSTKFEFTFNFGIFRGKFERRERIHKTISTDNSSSTNSDKLKTQTKAPSPTMGFQNRIWNFLKVHIPGVFSKVFQSSVHAGIVDRWTSCAPHVHDWLAQMTFLWPL